MHQPTVWPEPLRRMADGTLKQLNPYSGSSVWTVPRRGNRPLGVAMANPAPLAAQDAGRHCAFCERRYLETPPEKARLVREGDGWRTLRHLPAPELFDTVAEFRRIPNLFEIVSYDYWRVNYHYQPPDEVRAHYETYLSSLAGREHVLTLLKVRLTAEGMTEQDWDQLSQSERLEHAMAFFAGCHDVIVARRHFVDGATHENQLASSGTLTPTEHAQYTAFTVDALRALYDVNRYAVNVAVFQNWLKPAGASFDHLHKQLVAVDDRSVRTDVELDRLRANTNFYNEYVVGYAARQNLVIAENDHAVALAGFGHRYPAMEVYSKSEVCEPWEQPPEEVAGFSDLLHACHAATGSDVATNEEWHHRSPGMDLRMPWRVGLKWRVSTLAGFEGGTKIYLNTISPWQLRDRVVPKLEQLRGRGQIATDIAVGAECACRPNMLRYNPLVR